MKSELRVSECFYSIQGEGSTIGIPALFLRLTREVGEYALPQAPISNANARRRPFRLQRFQNRTAGNDQVGAIFAAFPLATFLT